MKTKYTVRFRAINRDIFLSIKTGKKKIETRAATVKYKDIVSGTGIVFSCGKEKFEKEIKKVEHFKTISALLKKYRPSQINPKAKTNNDLLAMYESFPGYIEKIKKCGLLAWTLI